MFVTYGLIIVPTVFFLINVALRLHPSVTVVGVLSAAVTLWYAHTQTHTHDLYRIDPYSDFTFEVFISSYFHILYPSSFISLSLYVHVFSLFSSNLIKLSSCVFLTLDGHVFSSPHNIVRILYPGSTLPQLAAILV